MKRLLYIAFKDFANLHFGANAKVLSQCRALSAYGYEVELLGRREGETISIINAENPQVISSKGRQISNPRLRSLLDKQKQIRDIKAYIRGKKYDACYIRYDFSDPGFIGLLKELKKVFVRHWRQVVLLHTDSTHFAEASSC